MAMHKALHHRDDVNRLYVSRKEEGRDLASIEDSVDASIQRLEDYIEKRGERLITATRNNINYTRTNTSTTRKQKWEEKQLYGRFKRQISNISHEITWTWQRKGNLKRETDSLLIAAQNNAIRTNHIKARIGKTQQNNKCRLCGNRGERINHIISESSKLAEKVYTTRHDWLGKVIHWELFMKFIFDHTNKWFMHNPASVLENDTRGFWDKNGSLNLGQTTRPYNDQQHTHTKKKRTCRIVHFAVLADHRVKLKETEKKDKYLDFVRELKKLGNMKVTFIPIVIGAFGTVTEELLKGLEELGMRWRVETIQTTTLLRTARILRSVLDIEDDLLSLKLQ